MTSTPTSRLCALIADDDPVQRHIMRECLEGAGYLVVDAADGAQALASTKAQAVDLFILDAMMPCLSGFELCEKIRRMPQHRRTPILVATSLEDVEAIDRAYDCGATYFITKPINWALLRHHIKYLLRSTNMENELINAKIAAEAASDAKSRFLSTMSHELRTPLNAIIGFSTLMLEDEAGEEDKATVRKYLESINVSGKHLLDIINSVLDISRIESGVAEFNKECFDLIELCRGLITTCRPLADQKELRLLLQTDLSALTIEADLKLIKQIVLNLVSNAIKFTDRGSVQIEIFQDASGFTLAVRDTGIGIPEDKIKEVFEPFTQAHDIMTQTEQGTGLGLTITKELVELHGGTISATSVRDEGSCFTCTFSRDIVVEDSEPALVTEQD